MKLFECTPKFATNNNPTLIHIASLLVKKAQRCGFDLQDSAVDFNHHSNYVYLWNEDEQIVLGLKKHHYSEGATTDEVDLIFSCPVTGQEFISENIEDIVSEYIEFVDSQDESDEDYPDAIYFEQVKHEIK